MVPRDPKLPAFWHSLNEDVQLAAENAKKAEVKAIAKTPGGRDVYAFFYGEKEVLERRANYNSACGAKDITCYTGKNKLKPVLMLVGGVHGAEPEGMCAALNLISLLETGKDLGGQPNEKLVQGAAPFRLIIIPIMNPDGRARFPMEALVGEKHQTLRYYGQGTWKDGSYCEWPDCKAVHPIKSAVDYLGAYYNDDGINMMHDNFFRPMAQETAALMQLCEDEAADCVILLHGGSNTYNAILQPPYCTREVGEKLHELSVRCRVAARQEGLDFAVEPIPGIPSGQTPPSFALPSAIHHICGGAAATFESCQNLIDWPGAHLDYGQIYRSHQILFEQMFEMYRP